MAVIGQRVGYVRVSSADQKIDRQVESIGEVDRTFCDRQSGKNAERPALTEMLAYCREGDTVRVASLDRLARNLDDLRHIVASLTEKGVRVEFVKEALTFTGDDAPMSRLLLSLLGAIAEFERSLINERQREGIALAKRKGVYRGRKPALTPEQIASARQQIDLGVTKAKVARDLGCSRATLYAALAQSGTYATRDRGLDRARDLHDNLSSARPERAKLRAN